MPKTLSPAGILSLILATASLPFMAPSLAQAPATSSPAFVPAIEPASDEGRTAIRRFQVPPGFTMELWAAEPDVAQGVSLYPDHRGRIFVSETFRHSKGVLDIRGIKDWLDEDLACRTADDRLAMMKRHLGTKFAEYGLRPDRVRLLWDATGAGHATQSRVFADGFNHPLDGILAGVIARGNDVWVGNIPNLWHLRDNDGDGVADSRRILLHGFGVRVGFLGHDLHGLTWGPDGRLYFSVGDRGANVVQNGRSIGHPDTGSVFRCNPDGSDLEEFAFGLRNPQDLVFDDRGNLFTGDNNSDGGDQARWTYLVEGGDSGWRIGWQFLDSGNAPNPRGPWNSEKMWHPQNDTQPAFLVPPIRNISSGPSGVSFYQGTGFPDSFQGTFTLVDFRGSSAGSGLWAFKLKPKGASFDMVEDRQFVWKILATDAKWGPDGALYILDWVEGWEQNGKGRIYKLTHPEASRSPAALEASRLLAEGFSHRNAPELLRLLGHPNQRVRLEAQSALAFRGVPVIGDLQQLAATGPSLHARLHALWALWQMALRRTEVGNPAVALDGILPLLRDRDPEIRANAARVLGDARHLRGFELLVQATTDENARVRHLAATALGRLGRTEAVPALLALLNDNADRDPVIRHAASHALAQIGDLPSLVAAARHASESVRLGAVLALRRMERAEIEVFLGDSSGRVVSEAVHAIHDLPISGAMNSLAVLIDRPIQAPAVLRRVLNANYRWGTPESANTLARFAANTNAPEAGRVEALRMLAEWPRNGGRDRVTGLWRPTAFARERQTPVHALQEGLPSLLSGGSDAVRAAAAFAAGELMLQEASETLARLVAERQSSPAARSAALLALSRLNSPSLPAALRAAEQDPDPQVRKAAVALLAKSEGDDALAPVAKAIESGTLQERQSAFAQLGGMTSAASADLLAGWLRRVVAGSAPAEVHLDVLEAALKRKSPAIQEQLARYEATLNKDPKSLDGWKVCLTGGNAEAGRTIFIERAEVSCVRCHKANGEGGEVGPELTGLIARQSREYILESIVLPNARIAEGFENLLITMKSGVAYAGVIKSETASELQILSPEDGVLTLKKAEIKSREKGLSAMPEGFGAILTRQDIRNLVEFIATLK